MAKETRAQREALTELDSVRTQLNSLKVRMETVGR